MKRMTVFIATLALVASSTKVMANELAPDGAIMFKNPNCSCCERHADHLREHGIDVRVVPTRDMAMIKEQAQVPDEVRSCHTITMNGYVIEGHVPIEAIKKLMNEQPKVSGIGLAGMPQGSPGMPGKKTEVLHIQAFNQGTTTQFLDM